MDLNKKHLYNTVSLKNMGYTRKITNPFHKLPSIQC